MRQSSGSNGFDPSKIIDILGPQQKRYVKAFGHQITLTDQPAISMVNRRGGQDAQLSLWLRTALTHLDDAAFQRRLDGAQRFISASMFHQARQKAAFQGDQADLFFHSLIDALVGLLGAPESDETRALIKSTQPLKQSKEA